MYENFCFSLLRAVWLNVPGLILIVTLCFFDGLVIFANYAFCDLRVEKKITSNDQVNFFIVKTFNIAAYQWTSSSLLVNNSLIYYSIDQNK